MLLVVSAQQLPANRVANNEGLCWNSCAGCNAVFPEVHNQNETFYLARF